MLTKSQKKRISDIMVEIQDIHEEVSEISASRQEHYDRRSSAWKSDEDGITFNDQLLSLSRAVEGLESAVSALGDLDTE